MMSHANSKMTQRGRLAMIKRLERGESARAVAADLGLAVSNVYRWWNRFREEGEAGLADRTSRPKFIATEMPPALKDRVVALRRKGWAYQRIADALGRSESAVARVAKERGVTDLKRLDPREPVIRYERDNPGELIHIDSKRLVRIDGIGHRITGDRTHKAAGIGFEHVFLAVDDSSRLAYMEVLPDESGASATVFMHRALAYFAELGVHVQRVMSDNAFAYKSRSFRRLCELSNVRQIFTKPYTPKTNGKAERLVRTLLREWAYERPYHTSAARTAALPRWLHRYNHHRPHTALGGNPPMTRILTGVPNLSGINI